MYAADVDDELVVDEDPHVVVAGEAEGLATLILKRGVNFGREKEIVWLAVVVLATVAESETIEREERAAREAAHAVVRREIDVEHEGLIRAWHVAIKRIERGRVADRVRCAFVRVDGFLIGAERLLNDAV